MYTNTDLKTVRLTAIGLFLMLGISSAWASVSEATRQQVNDRLNEAELALDAGDVSTAYRLVRSAAQLPTDNHGKGLATISARALGPETYGRLFDLRQKVRTALGKKAEANGLIWQQLSGSFDGPDRWQSRSAIGWYLAAMNADEIERMLRHAPAEREYFAAMTSGSADENGRFTFAMGDIEWYSDPLWEYEPISRELELQSRFKKELIPLLKKKIRQFAMAELEREATHFNRPLSEQEQYYSDANWAGVQEAFTGVEAEQPTPDEVRRSLLRTDDSKEMLKDVIDWLRLLNDRSELAPATSVAVKRGNTFMGMGDDLSLLVTVRQDAYDEARAYFYIAKDEARREKAQAAYMSLADEVAQYMAKRNAIKDKAEEKMRADGEAFEKAAEAMQKTDEEKEAFADEADALEAELDLDF